MSKLTNEQFLATQKVIFPSGKKIARKEDYQIQESPVFVPKTNKELYVVLDKLVQKGVNGIKEAENFANEHGLTFNIDIAYGMGGTYYPTIKMIKNIHDEGSWVNSYNERSGWVSSSSNC